MTGSLIESAVSTQTAGLARWRFEPVGFPSTSSFFAIKLDMRTWSSVDLVFYNK
jgi:hypothetical protein